MPRKNLYHVEVYRYINKNGKKAKTYSFNSRVFGSSIQDVRKSARSHWDDKAYIIKVKRV